MIATRQSPIQSIICPICRARNRLDARFCQQCGSDVLLDNIYRITRVIKEGGMGVVYQAIDADGEFYAIKEMHDRFTSPDERTEGIQRFKDEARLLRDLKGHPAVPQVYRSFIDEGRYYLSMEFIFGEDLEDILKRQKRFPEPQVLRWADQLCDVLEHLHSNKLIYRDMKPSNIMITHEGNVKIIDFGIAKLLQPGARGAVLGTPGYSPPEQYQGITTEQADVYALGATLHHLLTGRDPRDEPPFSFPPARMLVSSISRATSDAIQKALEKEMHDRWKSIHAFRRALPIPTGERRPTRPFDPVPRTETITRSPVQAAPPRPQPRSRQRRRGGSRIRRVFAAGLVAAGLAYGAIQFGPSLVDDVQQYLSNQIQAAPDGSGALPAVAAPAFRTTVTIEVPNDASDEAVLEALRQAYLQAAQVEYPNAQLDPNNLPQQVGGYTERDPTNNVKRVTATMEGTLVTQP